MEMELLMTLLGVAGGLGALSFLVATRLRRVVSTNEVHIVQSSKNTTSYGKDTANGNTYYEWPSSLPFLGVSKIVLPVSNFNVELKAYEAYDKGRLPLVLDVMAFFRIVEPNVAASRISSFSELNEQLTAIVQGAARTILASNDVEEIMQGRGKFGQQFTDEVKEQLSAWGVEAVKSIELMDIRDAKDSKVIHNIMAKKSSHIEMESRTEVAKNNQLAKVAEIAAQREVDLQSQEAEQTVGLRTIEAQRKVSISEEEMKQALKDQQKTTKEKEMAVTKVQSVRQAEINKEVQVVAAQQEKETMTLKAEGTLEAKRREAQGITLEGEAKASAEKAMQLAPIEASIVLAKEIGTNESYQKYLITIEQVKANKEVGVAQAGALEKADVKVISNTGSPSTGLTSVMDLFSSKGGTEIGGMLEGLAQTDAGKAFLDKFMSDKKEKSISPRADGLDPQTLVKSTTKAAPATSAVRTK